MKKTAIIIGAGPAGLTAALELLRKTDIKPVVVERSADIGGISKTVNYKANRIDIGGHRFFSKSDVVMNYWKELFEISVSPANYPKNKKWDLTTDNVFIKRDRLSRIYYLRNFFDYPVSLNGNTIKNLGLFRIIKIGFSYLWVKIFPIKNEKSLEDFFINRFGKVLYQTFFKDYTEKVWGKSCKELSAEWGAQRIKGLSVTKVISNYFKSLFQSNTQDISQKDKETSLIEKFLYPKYGPGQLWEFVAQKIEESGGEILMNCEFVGLMQNSDGRFTITCKTENQQKEFNADYVFSTTSVKNLVNAMSEVPKNVKTIANGLLHRNFITVGLLLNKLKIKNHTKIETLNQLIPDNWIYMQESDIKMGRIQIFNNWSPFMVADENNVWIGLEYFCDPGDEMWVMEGGAFIEMAINELEKVGIIDKNDVLDSTIIRMEDTYPVYFGSYDKFDIVREYLDKIENLYLIGRSGMHRYNNSDHSMLTAITAVQNIIEQRKDKSNIWDVNTEQDYHEEKERK
ncbi:MAG: NAD(P)/FAD-dependent oxidoreductase [Bacteroidales bacterium]|nr:NAD(P)/FAD-dependent oxidoreductase [Bacteroidales bacterium]MDD3861143.1 NAD(P)/FAD-dependent oxidoreductase [Bacteroidales bacterium]